MGAAVTTQGGALARSLFVECRRVLRPTGCLYVGVGMVNARPWGALFASLFNSGLFSADRWLAQSGFGSVHSFYADPTVERPFVIIPATTRALRAHERVLAANGEVNLQRSLMLRLGLPRLLYAARMFLAYP
jgi:hypothetical protein